MRYPVDLHCDYGLRAVSFSSIATTGGWPRKPQPLLKIHNIILKDLQDYKLVPTHI